MMAARPASGSAIGRACDPQGAAVERVGVARGRADILLTEEHLLGPDVAASLAEVGACSPLRRAAGGRSEAQDSPRGERGPAEGSGRTRGRGPTEACFQHPPPAAAQMLLRSSSSPAADSRRAEDYAVCGLRSGVGKWDYAGRRNLIAMFGRRDLPAPWKSLLITKVKEDRGWLQRSLGEQNRVPERHTK